MGQQYTAMPEITGHPFRDLSVVKAAVRRNWQELIQLNLWFLLTCLPIITIPAARTAMAKVSLLILLDRPCAVRRDYFSAFRSDFPDALKAGLLFLAGKLICLYGLFFYGQLTGRYPAVWVILLLLVLGFLFLLLAEVNLYPELASIQVPVTVAVKNAFLLTCLRPAASLFAVLARAVVLLIFLLLIPVAPLVFLTFLFFLPGLITACCAWPGIRQYLVKEDGASSD